jgi:hypothetical protein
LSARFVALFAGLVMLVAAAVPPGAAAADELSGRVLVQFRPGTGADARRAARAESGVTVYLTDYPTADAELWRVPAWTAATVAASARARPDVRHAEWDRALRQPKGPVRSFAPIGSGQAGPTPAG